MFTRIGRKLMKGATAELEENPPAALDQEKWSELLETGTLLGLGAMVLLTFLRVPKTPITVIVNVAK